MCVCVHDGFVFLFSAPLCFCKIVCVLNGALSWNQRGYTRITKPNGMVWAVAEYLLESRMLAAGGNTARS